MTRKPEDDFRLAAQQVAKLRQLVEKRKRELDAHRGAIAGGLAAIAGIEAELAAANKRKAVLEFECEQAAAAKKTAREDGKK